MTKMGESSVAFQWTKDQKQDHKCPGYIEVFPARLFKQVGNKGLNQHHTYTRGKKFSINNHFVLAVDKLEAVIDYIPYKSMNGWSVPSGILKLQFKNEKRDELDKVWWMKEGETSWRSKAAPVRKIHFDRQSIRPYIRPVTEKKSTKKTEIVVRKGQAELKEKLMVAYSGACCISGCRVPELLDAAHIDSYEKYEKGSDHPQNGLLLRADLHRLFDANFLGVDPDNKEVSVKTDDVLYQSFNGKVIAAPFYGDCAPDAQALQYRWKMFQSWK